jgi:hypothetical protein
MEKIKLLFTCPHNGEKKGDYIDPPIIESSLTFLMLSVHLRRDKDLVEKMM